MKIQKGDKVIVLKGKNKGTVGDVISVITETDKVIVSGVNIRTIHQKPKQKGEKGQIIKREGTIHVSNVSYYDEKAKKGSRIGYAGAGKSKNRVSKKTGEAIKKVGVQKKVKKDDKTSATKEEKNVNKENKNTDKKTK